MVGPGGQEVDQFVDVESLGPDLGRCFDSDEIFEEMGDGSEDENSGVNGRRRRTCHYVVGGN